MTHSNDFFSSMTMAFMNLKGQQVSIDKILIDSASSPSRKHFHSVLTSGTQELGNFSVGISQMNTVEQSFDCVPCARELCAVSVLSTQLPRDIPLGLTVM